MGSVINRNLPAEASVLVEEYQTTPFTTPTVQEELQLQLQQEEPPQMVAEQQQQQPQRQQHIEPITSTPIHPTNRRRTPPNMASVYKYSPSRRYMKRNFLDLCGSNLDIRQPKVPKKENDIQEPKPSTSKAKLPTEEKNPPKNTRPKQQYLAKEKIQSDAKDMQDKRGGSFPKWNLRI